MPMARSAVLAGRTVADLVRNIAIIGLMIAVGYAVGFRFHGGLAGAVGCIAVVAAFGFALSSISPSWRSPSAGQRRHRRPDSS